MSIFSSKEPKDKIKRDNDPEYVVNNPSYDPQRQYPQVVTRKKMHVGPAVVNSSCQHNEIHEDGGKWRCSNCRQIIVNLAGYSITSS